MSSLAHWWNDLAELLAFAGFVALATMWHRMRWEVNRAVPVDRRFRFWQSPWTSLRIYPLHKKLYPGSRLRLAHNILFVIWLPFGILGYFRLRQAMDAWLAR